MRGSRLTWRSVWSRHRCEIHRRVEGVPGQGRGHQADSLFQRSSALDLGFQAGRGCRGWCGMLWQRDLC